MSIPTQCKSLPEKVLICLKNITETLHINNPSLNITKNDDYGENHLGVIVKVQIINEEGKTINIIVKFGPRSSTYRSFFPIHSVYLRENYVYSKVLHEFTKLQSKKNWKYTFGYFPKFYGAVLDVDNEAVLLEDVKELGYKNMKREVSLSYSHALLVVRELGKLHAISFAMRDQHKSIFDELSQNMEDSYFTKFNSVDILNNCYKHWVLAARNSLNKFEENNIYDKIDAFKDKFNQVVCDIISTQLCQEYGVICHGDVWVGNLLFRYMANGLPDSVCFLDWQIARYGSPVLDLSQFLFTCTDKPLRDQHFEDLISAYYKSLSEFLEKFGSDPKKLFPMEILQQHLIKFSVFGLCMAIQVIWLSLNVPKEDFFDIDVATDIDVKQVVDHYDKPNTEEYNLRMRDIILDFFRFGYEF